MKLIELTMNNMRMMRIVSNVVITILLCSGHVSGQYDPKAKKVLDGMSDTYHNISSFTANIIYSMQNEEDDIDDSFEGKIGVKQDKFRLIAEDQEIIINDGNIWTYLSEENELSIDTYNPDDDDVTPSNIYTLYMKGYKYILYSEEPLNGIIHYVVDMSPEDKESEYFRIRLYINKSNSYLKKFILYAKSGNRYGYEINNFNPKANLSDQYFVFDEENHKDVEVIDLRMD